MQNIWLIKLIFLIVAILLFFAIGIAAWRTSSNHPMPAHEHSHQKT